MRKQGPNETKLKGLPKDGLEQGDPYETMYWDKSGRITKNVWHNNYGGIGNKSLTRTYEYDANNLLARETESIVPLKGKTRRTENRYEYLDGKGADEYTKITIDKTGKKTTATAEERKKDDRSDLY